MNFKKELQEVENQSKRFNADDDNEEDSGENVEMEVDDFEQGQPDVEEVEEGEEVDEEEGEYEEEHQATDEDDDDDEEDFENE